MNTVPPDQKGNPGNNKPSDGVQESIYPHQHETNITDGGEFLDDGIRMNDQPFEKETKEEQQTKSQTRKNNYYEFF